MMSKPLLFVGSNSAIQLYVDAATRQGITVAGIIDSDYYGNIENFKGLPVIGTELELDKWCNDYDFFIATNTSPDPRHTRDVIKRKRLISLVEDHNIKCINLIDPTAYIGTDVCLGNGVYIGFGAVVEHNVNIGSFVQIHSQVNISHDVQLGKNTVVQRKCGIGNVTVGNDVYIGMWTHIYTVKAITIGDTAIINPGLLITRNVEAGEYVKLTKDSIKIYRNITEII